MKQGRKVCGQRSCFLLSIQVKFNEPWKCWKNRAKKKAHTDTRTYKINMDKTREKKRDLWRWRRLTCVTFRHRFVRCQVKECQNLSLYAHWRHSSTAPPSTAGTQPIGLCCCADEESLVFRNIIRVRRSICALATQAFSRFYTWRASWRDDLLSDFTLVLF